MNKQITNSILSNKFYILATFLIVVAAFTTQIQAGVLIPKLVSRAMNGTTGNGGSHNFSISADGRFIAFNSDAANLVSGITDTNESDDIFLFDTANNSIRCLSLANPTTTGIQLSNNPKITPDGKYVIFTSFAENLVANDTNSRIDIFRGHDDGRNKDGQPQLCRNERR